MKSTRRLPVVLSATLTCFSMIALSGCVTRTVVLKSDEVVQRLPAGQPYTPTNSGWFVPDAKMHSILTELNNCK